MTQKLLKKLGENLMYKEASNGDISKASEHPVLYT